MKKRRGTKPGPLAELSPDQALHYQALVGRLVAFDRQRIFEMQAKINELKTIVMDRTTGIESRDAKISELKKQLKLMALNKKPSKRRRQAQRSRKHKAKKRAMVDEALK